MKTAGVFQKAGKKAGAWLGDLALGGLLGVLGALPYPWRVRLCGWVVATLIAPLSGWPKRVRANLALVMPELSSDQVKTLEKGVFNNIGRCVAELFVGSELLSYVEGDAFQGPGLPALDEARAAGRPVIFVAAHFGGFVVGMRWATQKGYPLGCLYRPMENEAFNARYIEAMSAGGIPLFPRNRKGMALMVRHLREQGVLGLMPDQRIGGAEKLTFMGHQALTALSAADLALKYGAALIPIYAIRHADGLSFKLHLQEPIAQASAREMMQEYNDKLEAMVRQHPEQWLWIHQRWKP